MNQHSLLDSGVNPKKKNKKKSLFSLTMSIKNQDSHALNYEMAQIQGQPEFTQFSELGPPRQFDFGPQMLTVGIIVFSVSQRGKFEVVTREQTL